MALLEALVLAVPLTASTGIAGGVETVRWMRRTMGSREGRWWGELRLWEAEGARNLMVMSLREPVREEEGWQRGGGCRLAASAAAVRHTAAWSARRQL